MPLYEYRCAACQEEFTLLQPMSAPQTGAKCPQCGSTNTQRKISTFANQSSNGGRVGSASQGGGCAPGG
jgi:putative FmdB family regulatory protein